MSGQTEAGSLLVFADLVLDPSAHAVTRAGREVALTRIEFALLQVLLRRPGQVLTRRQILAGVWGPDPWLDANTLAVHVCRVRAKLGGPRLVHTVRGVGYVLREADGGVS